MRQEMGIPDHLTCLLGNLFAGQEATVRNGHGTTYWFQTGKGVFQGCILSPWLFNLYAECIMWNAGLNEAQTGIKIAGRNINNFRYADNPTLMAESKEELKSSLMKVKEESEKAGLKLNVQIMKIMASGPITSWQIDGKTMDTVTDYFSGLQNHYRWWLQSWNQKMLVPWMKSYYQPRQHIRKQRHYLVNKVLSSQNYCFPVVMYGFESWTIKTAEYQRTDVFELWCWRRLLRVPWTARKSNLFNPKGNQSWIFIGRTDAEAEAPILWHLCEKLTHWKRCWCWERLKIGGERDDRGQDGWMASLTQWTWVWASSRSWWWRGKPGVLQSTGLQRVRHNWATELNWDKPIANILLNREILKAFQD